MTNQVLNGLQIKQGLSQEELADIKKLASICNSFDGIDLKLNWERLKQRPESETNDFLYYVDGELVGFTGLYCFHSEEIESSGMVHPNHRRKGIGRSLADAATHESKQRGIPKMIFICQAGSQSGKEFLEVFGTTYSFSEYNMELQDIDQAAKINLLDIRLRKAEVEDVPVIAHLDALSFGMSVEDAEKYSTETILKTDHLTFLALLGDEPIGKIGLLVTEKEAFIYGFGVHPDFQKRGYGKQILAETIRLQVDDHRTQIALEVACENKHALVLYQSCGFQETTANDYYIKLLP